MNERDLQCLEHINRHYQELLEEMTMIDSFEQFCTGGVVTKAIKMDILQIAENINCLSKESILPINTVDLRGIIDIRNHIAHGYATIDDEIIWNVIKIRLPKLIKDINELNK